MKKMSILSRSIIALASLAMAATYFLPVWRIDLGAPQYPEGLTLYIWLHTLTGQVDIINELNHYIGMKKIGVEMFPEFHYLGYAVGVLIGLGLLTALIGNRKVLFAYLLVLIAGGMAALYDFHQWGYNYGHNLDPKAAIQVPGFYYQPPLLGHKQLLNFDAYSFPASGGWMVVAAFVFFFFVWLYEGYLNKKEGKTSRNTFYSKIKHSAIALFILSFVFTSCKTEPQPFAYGKDACYYCKMTIMSPKFGGEVIAKKGKVYKFDDLHCLIRFLKSGELNQKDIAQTLAINYQQPNHFLEATSAAYVVSEQLHSPMNGNAAALADATSATTTRQAVHGQSANWETLYNTLQP